MSDLVERLREESESNRGVGANCIITRRDIVLAADRIEELEDALERSGINGLKRRIKELESYFKHPEDFDTCPNCGLHGDLEGHLCRKQELTP